ncbi:hypothetical protein BJ170DRAFT_681808 [Xylariales sp. AK1849]|nr:hypothetical protein BJ170DRAFT_681808 [Xylariales sp. AK1849]
MANDVLVSSLNFMTDAAHLLATTTPEVSAHLMSQRNALMFHNNLEQSDIQRQHVCGSCGHIMILRKESILKLEKEKSTRKRRKGKHVRTEQNPLPVRTQKQLTCGMCGRFTQIAVPPAPPITRRVKGRTTKISVAQSLSPAAPSSTVEPTKTSANASSKKRAKNRKQGLQALLQQSQTSSSKVGFGLGLTDFVKRKS